jgi:tripartite-type tricarboxylate transporter receptor subunit TctC
LDPIIEENSRLVCASAHRRNIKRFIQYTSSSFLTSITMKSIELRRRDICYRILSAALSPTLITSPRTSAQEAPRPIRLLVGAAPGSVMDVVARQIAETLNVQARQPVFVDNRPSAGGIQALDLLRQSSADGMTLSLVHAMQLTAAPSLFANLPYNTQSDFAPIGILFSGPQVLVVHPSLGVRTWGELIRLLKAEPGRIRFSSPGNGTPGHVAMEQILFTAGVSAQHIPYRGPAATSAVLSGEVEMMLEGVMPLLPLIREGRLQPLALGGSRRVPVLSDVPTFGEVGISGIGAVWVGVIAPRSTPDSIVRKLNAMLANVVQSPPVRTAFESSGRIVDAGSPEAMAEAVRKDIPLWRDVIKRARISIE